MEHIRTCDVCGVPLKKGRQRRFCSWACHLVHVRKSGVRRPREKFNSGEFYPENMELAAFTYDPQVQDQGGSQMIGEHRPKAATISRGEFRILLDNCLHKKMVYLLWILYESGCRVSEVLGLRAADVEFRQGYALLFVDGKTGKRAVPVAMCYNMLASLAEGRKPEEPLFRNPYITWHRRLEKIREDARKQGLTKNITFHSFRHNRATELLRDGVPDQVVKKMFGWSVRSPMLNVYCHLDPVDVINAVIRPQLGPEKLPHGWDPSYG